MAPKVKKAPPQTPVGVKGQKSVAEPSPVGKVSLPPGMPANRRSSRFALAPTPPVIEAPKKRRTPDEVANDQAAEAWSRICIAETRKKQLGTVAAEEDRMAQEDNVVPAKIYKAPAVTTSNAAKKKQQLNSRQ